MDGHCPWKPQLYSSLSRNEPNEPHVAPVRPPCNQIQTICTAPYKTHATTRCTPCKRRASARQELCTKSTRTVQEIEACICLYPIVFKQIQDLPGTWSKPHCAGGIDSDGWTRSSVAVAGGGLWRGTARQSAPTSSTLEEFLIEAHQAPSAIEMWFRWGVQAPSTRPIESTSR